MKNLINPDLLQTYLLDNVLREVSSSEIKNRPINVKEGRLHIELHKIETTLNCLHDAELINTDSYKKLCFYFSHIRLKDCKIEPFLGVGFQGECRKCIRCSHVSH